MPEEQLSLFSGFEVSITIFDGPLDLLLHLVRREKVDISEVALSQVTAQYLEYLDTLQALNVDLSAEFVVVACQLLYLKSCSLLPRPIDDEPEDDLELDPQVELARRLEEYQTYREAADTLEQARQLRQRIYLRSTSDEQIGSGFVQLSEVSVFDMIAAVSELLKRSEGPPPRLVRRREVTVGQRLPEILTELHVAGGEGLLFTRLVDMPASRVYIIVTFLAILELIRRRRVRVSAVEQESNFRVWLLR